MTKGRTKLEKMRDILVLFIVDTKQLEDLSRKLTYRGLTKEGYARLAEEYGPKLRREQGDYLPLSDNYVREKAGLSASESKQYILLFLDRGYLVRDEDGDLEITGAGTACLDELHTVLATDAVKAMKELPEFSPRRKGNPTLTFMLACLWL
jgi:hypothetical protein